MNESEGGPGRVPELLPEIAVEEPPIVVDVVRPLDLAAFTVEAYRCAVVTTATGPELRPKAGDAGEGALVVVHLGFQHLAERAIYETPEGSDPPPLVPNPKNPDGPPVEDQPADGFDPPDARPELPIDARPARATRLVFEVPAGTRIPFSTQGLLDAMSRLRMVVHPLAAPGDVPEPKAFGSIGAGGLVFILPGGVKAVTTETGMVLDRARAAEAIDMSTAEGIVAASRAMHSARLRLATIGGTATRRVAETAADAAVHAPIVLSVGDRELEVRGVLGPGGLAFEPGRIFVPRRPRSTLSRPPKELETAIEAPYRLVISPSVEGAWAHSTTPVTHEDAPHRVELWHTRLSFREERAAESTSGPTVDSGTTAAEPNEHLTGRRIIRAVWARDRDDQAGWQTDYAPAHINLPFRTSLDGADRHMLVRQTSETWVRRVRRKDHLIPPSPVEARKLWLSTLGAWLDLHGTWDTDPYSKAQMASILLWDHVAPVGRDQFVRVMYPGYLYPFGHRAALVKITERKMKDESPSLAGLYQRKFLVLADPVRVYGDDQHRDLPLRELRIRPLVTPTLDDPGDDQNSYFWPAVGGERYRFVLDALDREDRAVRLQTPLLWVAAHYPDFADIDHHYTVDGARHVQAEEQLIAFAPVLHGGDTAFPTWRLSFLGEAGSGTSRPNLEAASIRVPAAEHLSPAGRVKITYTETFVTGGFGGSANQGEVWAEVAQAADPDAGTEAFPKIAFGGGGAGSDKAGGFVQPSIPIGGLSRLQGVVGDPVGMAAGTFDPKAFLGSAFPMLFGLVPLDDLITDLAPDIVSEAFDRVEALIADMKRAVAVAEQAAADAQRQLDRAASAPAAFKQKAQEALTKADALVTDVTDAVNALVAALGNVAAGGMQPVADALDDLVAVAATMADLAPSLPPLARNQLAAMAKVMGALAGAADLLAEIERTLGGLAAAASEGRFRFEWQPALRPWPAPPEKPILSVPTDGFTLAVDGRVSGGTPSVEVLAELRDFTLHLLPREPLVRIPFEHMSFRSGSNGKTEVDVVLGEIEFVGILAFIETLKDVIPFDGFSDPPYLDISTEGLTAGFSLALPSVAIGVFTLSNISLSADVQVPFLGNVVTVGFGFCSRERPFTLAVAFLGGGGWFLLRLSPDGLDVLEVGLEAGATLSIDLGVASGSISAMIGVYMRLEGDSGSLTGYFRLRGEVDVLGLISASIELYLALRYEFKTGKMIGEATITVEVDVLCFSGSVKISCQRQFAGSNGDPTFAEVMAVKPDNTSKPWSDYCLAFAGE